jgi:hypothetical protein
VRPLLAVVLLLALAVPAQAADLPRLPAAGSNAQRPSWDRGMSRAVEDLLRTNGIHCESPLWNIITGLEEQLGSRDPDALERRERARRRIGHLRAKAASTTFPAEAFVYREQAAKLAAAFDIDW